MTEQAVELAVTADAAGERFDRWLSRRLSSLSRSHLARLVDAGMIRLDGRAVKPGHKLRGGERVQGSLAQGSPTTLQPEAIPLPIVYQDADLLVVDKPAGLVVHPAPGHRGGTLVHAVLGLWTDMPSDSDEAGDGENDRPEAVVSAELRTPASGESTVPIAKSLEPRVSAPTLPAEPPQRPGIVHRLDRETSGLMVVARHPAAQASLQRQFAARSVHKQYLALVNGQPASDRGTIEAPIGRDPRERRRMAVVAAGRPAITRFRVLERFAGDRETPPCTLVEATLETGRTHQLRVHFAAIGHPILGDPTYGVPAPKLGLTRQFLHARRLAFDHPTTGERLTFESPLPDDLAAALRRLGSTEDRG